MTAVPHDMPVITVQTTTHDTSLDGLRGLAATIVVIHHYLLGLYPAMVFNKPETIKSPLDTIIAITPLNLLIGGHFAVCIFFILSAHVLTKNHVANANGVAMISAMVKRYPRLGIPVFISVMISFLALWINNVISAEGYKALTSTPVSALHNTFITFKAALIEGSTGALFLGSNKFNGPLWTISIEFFGSLGIFLLLLLIPPNKPKWRWAAYTLAIPLTWGTYYLAFIMGMTLSELTSQTKFLRSWMDRHAYITFPMMAFGLLLGSIPMHHTDWQGTIYQYVNSSIWRPAYHIVGAYLIVTSVIYGNIFKSILNTRPLKFLGEISFSMYLLHVVVIQYFGHKLIPVLIPHTGFHAAVGIMAIPTLILIGFASVIFKEYVDKPAILLANRLGSYIKNRCRL
ncbi:MAG: acyltransferase [Burkholderiales bacterium]|nr:acyltransferase [Burkholderiales bacterium]